MNSKQRFMATIRGEATDRVPVSPILMFLAADRAKITYREFAGNGHALAEAQLLMRQRYGVDAITACSDAFRLSADLGGEMAYPESKPPFLAKPLVSSSADVARLKRPDPMAKGSRMADRCLGVSEMARAAKGEYAVLGWVDMPFAEACAACGVSNMMMLLVDEPETAHLLLEHLTACVIDFAVAQVRAGADGIGVGDAAASLASSRVYTEFVLPYEQRVNKAIHEAGGLSKLHICGNTKHLLEQMAMCGSDLYNVDHMVPLERARDVYASRNLAYKGNLDPVADMMQATPAECEAKSHQCIAVAKGTRFMLSPGCEIPADTTDAVMDAFCRAPQTYRE